MKLKQFIITLGFPIATRQAYDYLFENGIEFPMDNGKRAEKISRHKQFYIDEGTIFSGSQDSEYGKDWRKLDWQKDRLKIIQAVKWQKENIDLSINRVNSMEVEILNDTQDEKRDNS